MNVAMTCDLYITAKTAKCRQNTLDGYISAIRCHVLPKWGERELADIRRKEVQEWVDSIATAGAATKAHKMLQQVFRWAIKTYELEIFDPTSGVELPAGPIYRREVMTAKEIAYMLREAVGKPWEANIILAVALGLRPSEALGVDWSDIDWRSGWVHIQRGCHTLQSGETVEYPCKTRLSDRYLKLPRWALVRLRQIRGQRRRGRVRGDLTPRQVYTQYKRFLKSIGLGRCSIEGLRHSWATLAIASGAAIADVSVAMGHTTTRMVIEHYLMSTRAVSKRATDAAGRAIEEGLEAYAMAAQLSLGRIDIGGECDKVEFFTYTTSETKNIQIVLWKGESRYAVIQASKNGVSLIEQQLSLDRSTIADTIRTIACWGQQDNFGITFYFPGGKMGVIQVMHGQLSSKVQQLSLSTVIKIRPVRTSISRQYASTATVAAPQVEGYVFVAWLSCVTDGWVASVYTADPSNSRTSIWVATHGAYTSGQGDVACYALYAKSKQLSLGRVPTLEDKVRGVHIDENADGVPKILFTTSKDTYIVTFGEALEWWRQSDETYHRHPLQLSLGQLAYNHDNRVQIKWVDPGKDPEHPSGLYAIIDGIMWCDLYLGR